MIKIENVEVTGWEHAIRGIRNLTNSWDRSDSEYEYDNSFLIGEADHKLLMGALTAGDLALARYRQMIVAYLDIIAPLYWWTEFDAYKVGMVANACSTMHEITEKEFTLEDFSCEHLIKDEEDPIYSALNDERLDGGGLLGLTVNVLNHWRKKYLETKDKKYWWQIIQLIQSSYNQKRTVILSYDDLAGIYSMAKDHCLDEWREFCRWIERLPYSEIIIGET